ncbi:hypothetical protein [Bacillus infantis]|uniref:hypothetical protein n=1 Tax=Bacillus infantis TaxID=324767 RepID=UPI003CF780F7
MKKIISLVGEVLEDLFVLVGLIILITTTYFINELAASYLTGLAFLIVGILLARKGKGKQKERG